MKELYESSEEYAFLLGKDEYSDEDMAKLESLDGEVKTHAINVAAIIRRTEDYLMTVCNAQARLKERLISLQRLQERVESRINYLTDYLLSRLVRAEISSITDHPDFTIKRKLNPPKVLLLDTNLIPDNFYKEWKELRLDKTMLKEVLSNGNPVPGAALIQNERLEIK